jgi:hypothetical protein
VFLAEGINKPFGLLIWLLWFMFSGADRGVPCVCDAYLFFLPTDVQAGLEHQQGGIHQLFSLQHGMWRLSMG